MGDSSERYSEQNRDEYQEGILDDSKQQKVGFFRHWLNIGRDSAMKGIDVGNNLVNQVNLTIQKSMEAKYNAEIAKAEAEAKAKYGSDTREFEEALKRAQEEAYQKFKSEEALRQAEEAAKEKLPEEAKDDGAGGHTVEEWSWEVSEDGMSGKWVLKSSS